MQPPLISNKPLHILLAEDDADDRDLFVEAFSIVDPNIYVETVDNGETLMDHLRATKIFPNCIFLDLNMPKKNGKECLHEIKKDEKIRDIPVIIYTTSLNLQDIDEMYNKGASCFIRKPSSFQELTHILDKFASSPFFYAGAPIVKTSFVLNSR